MFKKTNARIKDYQKNDNVAYLFVLPALVFFLAFVLYPAISTFRLAFYDWDFLSEYKTYVGFDNFIRLFQMNEFYMVLGNTALYTFITVILKVFGGVLLANFVFTHVKGKVKSFIVESALFMPIVIPMSVIAMIFNSMFDTDYGIVNGIIKAFNSNPVGWLTDVDIALYTIMFLDVFKGIGFFFMISLIAMRNIPKTYYEAADMDGAGSIRVFTNITFPLIGNNLVYLLVTAFLSSFQVFEPIYLLLEGKFGDTKITISYMLWQKAFVYRDVGLASTIAIVIFIIALVVTLIQIFVTRKLTYNDEK